MIELLTGCLQNHSASGGQRSVGGRWRGLSGDAVTQTACAPPSRTRRACPSLSLGPQLHLGARGDDRPGGLGGGASRRRDCTGLSRPRSGVHRGSAGHGRPRVATSARISLSPVRGGPLTPLIAGADKPRGLAVDLRPDRHAGSASVPHRRSGVRLSVLLIIRPPAQHVRLNPVRLMPPPARCSCARLEDCVSATIAPGAQGKVVQNAGPLDCCA